MILRRFFAVLCCVALFALTAQAQGRYVPGGEIVLRPAEFYPDETPEQAQRLDALTVDFLSGQPTVFQQSPAKQEPDDRPMVALVIDDFGPSLAVGRQILSLEGAERFTPSVLPGYQATGPLVQILQSRNFVYLIHFPMQALADPDGSKAYLVGRDTPDEEIGRLVGEMKSRFPLAWGLNNHRGSRATSDKRVMKTLVQALKKNNLAFLDSRTSPKSVAAVESRAAGLPTLENQVFIDNRTDGASMKKQFVRALSLAQKQGYVVAICHARSTTVPFLRWLVDNPPKDVQFVTLRQLSESGRIRSR